MSLLDEIDKYLDKKSAKDMIPFIVTMIIVFIAGLIALTDASCHEYIPRY